MNGPSASHLAALAVISDLIRRPSEQQIPVGGVVRAYAAALGLYAEGAALSDLDNGGWLPIETAPKDGTRILAWGRGEAFVTEWRDRFRDGFGEVHQGWVDPDIGHLGPAPAYPTHWMPLPPAPGEQP